MPTGSVSSIVHIRSIAWVAQVAVLGGVFVLASAAGPWVGQIVATDPTPVLIEDVVVGKGGDSGALPAVELPIRTNMLGARWDGSAQGIELRAKGADDAWSAWTEVDAESDEGPDANSVEAQQASDHQVNVPVWVGDATDVELRVAGSGTVRNLELAYINSTGTATASDRVITSVRTTAAEALGSNDADAYPAKPSIISRAGWGADESIRKRSLSIAPTLKGAVLHHTVNVNGYSRSEAAALMRGIYTYHVRSNGWNDIGYNFVVDRYGRVYEGRYGGTTNNVIGAHAMGFNTSTTGIALLGTHDSSGPSAAARSAVTKLVSWRLDKAHVNPAGNMTLTSAGNDKYPAGRKVTKGALAGHRDFYYTACPGGAAYTKLGSLRSAAWSMGGPKFASPTATATYNGDQTVDAMTVRAVGNRSMTYTLTVVRRSDNATVKRLTQNATNAAIVWDGSSDVGAVPSWDLRWGLAARASGIDATPYVANLRDVPPKVDITQATGSATLISPNGDGLTDRFSIRFRLNTPSKATLVVERLSDSARWNVFVNRQFAAGAQRADFTGVAGATTLGNGAYKLILTAHDAVGRGDDSYEANTTIDRTIAFRTLSSIVSPNGDGALDITRAGVTIADADGTTLTMRIRNAAGTIVRTTTHPVTNGSTTLTFDGDDDGGTVIPDGRYTMRLTSPNSTYMAARAFTVDATRPMGFATRRADKSIRISVSEAVAVVGYVKLRDGRTIKRTVRIPRGWSTLTQYPQSRTLTITDGAANSRVISVRR